MGWFILVCSLWSSNRNIVLVAEDEERKKIRSAVEGVGERGY